MAKFIGKMKALKRIVLSFIKYRIYSLREVKYITSCAKITDKAVKDLVAQFDNVKIIQNLELAFAG